jgi:hypothetical protein
MAKIFVPSELHLGLEYPVFAVPSVIFFMPVILILAVSIASAFVSTRVEADCLNIDICFHRGSSLHT